jgi:hypothetical protein
MDSLWPEARRVLKQTLTAEQFQQWIEPLKVTTLQTGLRNITLHSCNHPAA